MHCSSAHTPLGSVFKRVVVTVVVLGRGVVVVVETLIVVVLVETMVVEVVVAVVLVEEDPQRVKPTWHVCVKSLANASQMPALTNLQGPLLPPTQSLQARADANEVVRTMVVVEVVVELLLVEVSAVNSPAWTNVACPFPFAKCFWNVPPLLGSLSAVPMAQINFVSPTAMRRSSLTSTACNGRSYVQKTSQ